MSALFAIDEFAGSVLKTQPFSGPTQRANSVSELDVRAGVLEDLALKTLYSAGSLSVLDLAEKIKLSYGVTNELFTRLRTDLCCQVTGMVGTVPQIAITTQGRA